MTTIAIDPGPHVGIAIHTDSRIENYPTGDQALKPGEYHMLMVTEPVKLWDIINSHKPLVIVLENFASGGLISRDGQSTIRLVGAVELAAYITGAELVLQSPQERYSQMDNARQMLKAIGRKLVTHEVDSLAHLLLYEDRLAKGLRIRRRSFETTTS